MYNNKEFENLFLSYGRILEKLQGQQIKNKSDNELTYKDLLKAISVMQRKHPSCRWKSQIIKSKRYYILIEGYYWLLYVYFQKGKSFIDADIDFFEKRIKQYEELLDVKAKNIFCNDMYVDELEGYFKRKSRTIVKAIVKMEKNNNKTYRYVYESKIMISTQGIEWLCKNCFKQKYLELLEEYKMELTEKYIEKGYLYDNFLGIN